MSAYLKPVTFTTSVKLQDAGCFENIKKPLIVRNGL